MSLAERRSLLLAIIASVIVAVATLAFSYHVTRVIPELPTTPTPPTPPQPPYTPPQPIIQPLSCREAYNVVGPASDVFREFCVIVMSSEETRRILENKTYTVLNIDQLTGAKGELGIACGLISFLRLEWLEFNATDTKGEPLEYIGWAQDLRVCVDFKSKRVVGVEWTLPLKIGGQLPESMSPRARVFVEKALSITKSYLAGRYGFKEDDVTLTFYAVVNGIAYVKVKPKTGGEELVVKVDVESNRVIEVSKAYS